MVTVFETVEANKGIRGKNKMPVSSRSGDSHAAAAAGGDRADLEQLDELKKRMMKDAESLLLDKFPDRIAQLNALLKSPEFNLDLSSTHAKLNIPRPNPSLVRLPATDEPEAKRRRTLCEDSSMMSTVEGTKVMTMTYGTVDVNKTVMRLLEVVKPHVLQQLDDCNLLKMWIEFLIPKVEDGNNFGVDIQEECLKEVSTIESEAATYVDQGMRYFMARGKIVAKVAKYPFVEDLRKTVDEIDERHYFSLRLIVQELRNNYAGLHDMLTKNLEKIKKPRSSNATESLY
ncbi:proteasome activator complex subunit 3-like isoform X1 [Varroa destructor]|uniref:Proteasome activator complex subunit 3 n=2 Tax=Varroa destructor TaxID=109461 RepID=A0A7M7MHH3_VARDE|nr:proteasome activator complex subunit 3-like isoform X1 [Varroa destructor]